MGLFRGVLEVNLSRARCRRKDIDSQSLHIDGRQYNHAGKLTLMLGRHALIHCDDRRASVALLTSVVLQQIPNDGDRGLFSAMLTAWSALPTFVTLMHPTGIILLMGM